MSWWAAAIAAADAILGDSAKKGQTEWNKEQQLDYERKAPAAQMQGYREAGLNPMLAYSQGVDFSGIQQGSGITSVSQNYGQITSAQAAMKQAETSESQSPSVIESNLSSANRARAEADVARRVVDRVKEETLNVHSDTERIKALILNLEEERQNLIKTGYNLTETGNVLVATFEKLRAEVPWLQSDASLKSALEELNRLDISAAKKFDNFGREFKQYEPIINLLKHLFRPYGGHR